MAGEEQSVMWFWVQKVVDMNCNASLTKSLSVYQCVHSYKAFTYLLTISEGKASRQLNTWPLIKYLGLTEGQRSLLSDGPLHMAACQTLNDIADHQREIEWEDVQGNV